MDFKFDDYLNSNKGKLNPAKAEEIEIEVNSEENKIQKIAEKLVFNKKSLTKEEIEFYRNNPREIDKKYSEISNNARNGAPQDKFKKGTEKIKKFFSNFTKKNKNNLEIEKEDDATIGEPDPKEENPLPSEAPSVSDIEKENLKTELLNTQEELLKDSQESKNKIIEQTIIVNSLNKEQLEDQIQLNNLEIKKLRILITEAEKSSNEPEVLKLETEIRVLEEKQNEIKNKLMETEKVLFFNSKMKELRILLSEAEKSNNEPEVLKLENEIRDLENIQNPKQKITEEKIEQSKTPPPIPKPREKVEYQSLLIYNNLSRKEYFDFKNLKPKNVNPEYAKEYQEQLILKEKAYRESKNKIVTALVMEGRQQEAKEFLMHEVEIKRKNDVENGGLGPKIKQGISNGIEAWDKWGVEHTDKEGNLVKGNVLKRLAKMGVSMTLIGLTASWSVEKLANIGGTATALDGGTTSYLLNKLKIGLGLGAIMETIPPKHKKWVGKLVTMTVIAGGATLAIAGGGLMAGMAVGASSAVGYGLSKLAQGRFSEKKIDERAEKMKTDNTINVENIEEDSAEFERQAEEAIIKAENTRLKRKLAGATAALVGSVATLEFSGMVRDHQNELTESENIKNQEINTVEESTVERYVTVGDGDGVTQALSELNKGGAVPSWFSAELGPNPTPSELAQFAKDIDTYRPDSPEDSLVLHKGDSIGFKNDCLVLGRGGETFILAKPDGSGGFTQGDWQEQMTNEKFMDTIDTMQEKEAHENQLVSDLNSQTEQAPSTSPMIDDNTMPYEPITTKPIA
ncbi:MAG: hypothetical protein QG585_286, partial [Patescibacteria group bacterium]|nr:hypothetical protein [Patescibacteria group bacterium]